MIGVDGVVWVDGVDGVDGGVGSCVLSGVVCCLSQREISVSFKCCVFFP